MPLTTIKGSVWQTLGPDLSIGTGYRESLDAAFATKSAPASVGVPSKDLGGCKEKKEVNIIEPKRGQNVAIGLGRYRLTDEQFHTAFVALDPSILTAETSFIWKMANKMPTIPATTMTASPAPADATMMM